MSATKPRTLFDKIWDAHVVEALGDGTALLYIDRHLVHEVTSPQAFEGLRAAGRPVRRPDATVAVVDHNVPTDATRFTGIAEPDSALQVATLERNVAEFGVPYIALDGGRQGIVHIIGPELGAYVETGASPRGTIAFFEVARALAVLRGRAYVVPEDVKELRHSVLRHRIHLSFEALADRVPPETVVDAVFAAVPTP